MNLNGTLLGSIIFAAFLAGTDLGYSVKQSYAVVPFLFSAYWIILGIATWIKLRRLKASPKNRELDDLLADARRIIDGLNKDRAAFTVHYNKLHQEGKLFVIAQPEPPTTRKN